jgi:outer membrane protein assembly factor BamB
VVIPRNPRSGWIWLDLNRGYSILLFSTLHLITPGFQFLERRIIYMTFIKAWPGLVFEAPAFGYGGALRRLSGRQLCPKLSEDGAGCLADASGSEGTTDNVKDKAKMVSRKLRLRNGRVGLLLCAALMVAAGAIIAYLLWNQERFEVDEARLKKLQAVALPDSDGGPAKPGDWPQWRGPNRDGVSGETGLLTSWPEEGPKLIWKQKAGIGYSSLAVAEGRVYTLIQDEDDEVLVCWNAKTGEELWRFHYPSKYEESHGSGPRSTPTVDGDRIYTVGAHGIFHCLDALKGEPIWRHDLLEEFNAPLLQYGVTFSPLVEGDLVLTSPGGANGNSLAAFDKISGKLVWKKLDDPAAYSSPVAATFGGIRQVIFFTQSGLVSISPRDGTLYWRYPWETKFGCNIATPIVVGDYVFISTGYDKGCVLLEITKSGEASFEAQPVYEHNQMRNHFSTSVRYKDALYGFDESTLICMDFRTGKTLWEHKGLKKGSLLIADGHLIILGESGEVVLAEATPEAYRQIGSFQFSRNKCWTVPVLAQGRLYLRDEEYIACYQLGQARE